MLPSLLGGRRLPEYLKKSSGTSIKCFNNKITLAEAVLELACKSAEVAHATGAGGLAADGLSSPVVYPI